MSSKDENVKASVMGNVGSVDKDSVPAYIQSAVDSGKGAQQGLSDGMSAEGQQTGGKYSTTTSNAQSTVDKAKN